ncbi:endonuclease/exonuclease/phosphatase family protein [Lentisphaera profundi]|uniref:Endonuclease/exonuclease/phosphatase family protein n=1 Tax=Lentisphaera profundi TaxID=1658616 RepID=A0ABY7VUC8_9BACT|nr:endonuclease/exonuclease/phosphatase family protein [Lentisphaera profundi]WDE97818.1 endonuclease/exonuclease/phosphatase family protein [Lentisphaera profundi]
MKVGYLKLLFLLIFFTQVVASGQIKLKLEPVKVLSYNLYNYNPSQSSYQLKSSVSRKATANIIAGIDADIVLLSELGHGEALEELLADLLAREVNYSFSSIVKGPDSLRRLCILAKSAPKKIDHRTRVKFKLKGKDVFVSRGFAYCVFEWQNDYRLHFIGAHLKSKIPTALGQTDMRRYEARQLHYLVDSILKNDPQANIVVAGDMNDTFDSSPIKEIQYRRYRYEKRLYDLRPYDKSHASWTHYYDKSDEYSRIDYFFCSYSMLGEIDYDLLSIPHSPHWFIASDHRPLLLAFTPVEKEANESFALFENATRKNIRPQYQSWEHFEGPRKASKEKK